MWGVTPCTDAYHSSLSTSDLQGVSSKRFSWLPYRCTGTAIAHLNKPLSSVHTAHCFERTPLHQKNCPLQGVLSTLLPTSSQEGGPPNPLSITKGKGQFAPNRYKPTRKKGSKERGYNRKEASKFIAWRQQKRWTAQANQI